MTLGQALTLSLAHTNEPHGIYCKCLTIHPQQDTNGPKAKGSWRRTRIRAFATCPLPSLPRST